MLEVKANALEESFDAICQADRMAGIEARMDAMDAALKGQAERAVRPPLDGAKGSAVDPARAAFTERYLRRGIEAGVELKSFSGASGAAGGYAVPREIDQMIEVALKAISPIRAIANVVRTGSAGYRKLVTTGGTVSGWASEVSDEREREDRGRGAGAGRHAVPAARPIGADGGRLRGAGGAGGDAGGHAGWAAAALSSARDRACHGRVRAWWGWADGGRAGGGGRCAGGAERADAASPHDRDGERAGPCPWRAGARRPDAVAVAMAGAGAMAFRRIWRRGIGQWRHWF